jgi:hypothetical protein
MDLNIKIEQLIKNELIEIFNLGFTYETKDRVNYGITFREIFLTRNPVRIKIGYYIFPDAKKIRLSIHRTDKDGAFSIEEYLKYKKIENNYHHNSFENETDEEYISRYFKMFKIFLDDDLMDVILGKTFIHIPFEWGPYK